MKTFEEWRQHYGYDPKSTEAQADYELYKERLAFFQSLAASVTQPKPAEVAHENQGIEISRNIRIQTMSDRERVIECILRLFRNTTRSPMETLVDLEAVRDEINILIFSLEDELGLSTKQTGQQD